MKTITIDRRNNGTLAQSVQSRAPGITRMRSLKYNWDVSSVGSVPSTRDHTDEVIEISLGTLAQSVQSRALGITRMRSLKYNWGR
jgi:hypothetical protein